MALTKIDDRGLKSPIDLLDNEKIRFGTGNDLEVFHDGTDSWLKTPQNIYLQSVSADTVIKAGDDIRLQVQGSDNAINCIGDGAVELYYDGSKKFETFTAGFRLCNNSALTMNSDSSSIYFGADDDMRIIHDGSNAIIRNTTGNLRLEAKSGELGFRAIPDGAVELYHDNSKKLETTAAGVRIYNTAAADAELRITASEGRPSVIIMDADDADDNADIWRLKASDDGSYYLQNYASGSYETNIKANGNGSVELYYDNVIRLETTASGVNIPGGQYLQVKHDTGRLTLGVGDDLQLWHDGDDSYISHGNVGHLFIRTASTDKAIKCVTEGGVELHWDDSKKFETTSDGVSVTGKIQMTDHSSGTTGMIILGADGDMKLFHNNSNAILQTNTGELRVLAGNDSAIVVKPDNAVELYHDNSKKLETTSTGVNVTGAITVNGAALGGGLSVADYYVHSQTTLDDGGSSDEGHFGGGNWTKIENASSSTTSVTSDALGVFSFPSTGMYKIELLIEKLNSGSVRARIQKTTDNGSNWSFLVNTEPWDSGAQGIGKAYFNCTNVSNDKIRMYAASQSGSNQTVESIKAFIEKLN